MARWAQSILALVVAATFAHLTACSDDDPATDAASGTGAGGPGSGPGAGSGAGNGSGGSGASEPVTPVTSHPRMWVTQADLPGLRSKAVDSNPVFVKGLRKLANRIVADMDSGALPSEEDLMDDEGAVGAEADAMLLAFMSLITEDAAARDDYAARARTILMQFIDRAKLGPDESDPIREPDFLLKDRSRWTGESFGLTVDWIYPYLSKEDKASIRDVFLMWSEQQLHAQVTTHNHPEPVGMVNDPALLSDPRVLRWAGNNYFTAHMRNLGLMSMALDEADDPDNALRGYLDNATGAWLYMTDALLRGDARGGWAPEGMMYGPSTMSFTVEFLWALHTAGLDDTALRGQQVSIAKNSFWEEAFDVCYQNHAPGPQPLPAYPNSHHPIVDWGDLESYIPFSPANGDFISVFAPLGLYAASRGDTASLDAARWIQLHLTPGDEALLEDRVENTPRFAILYFMLLDPTAAPPVDPRPNRPLDHFAPGLGMQFARTGWDADATFFHFQNGWSTIDHQHGDGNNFGFYRRGEWLTKDRSGYGADPYASTALHNAVAIQNSEPDHTRDYRGFMWETGSQWISSPSGDGKILARSVTEDFVYLSSDATERYNSDYENMKDVTHASRAIVWMKPDHIVIYDRAETASSGRFKRFWLQLPAAPSISGSRATATTPAGQKLYVTSLIPVGAGLSSQAPPVDDNEPAVGEPMVARLRIEAPGGASARFLTVLQGADAGASADTVSAVVSSAGTSFAGTMVGGRVVLFPEDLGPGFQTTSFTAPSGARSFLVTGLEPGAGYSVARDGDVVTVTAGGRQMADSGGILAF